MAKRFNFIVLASALLVGVLYLTPNLFIKRAVEASGHTFSLAQFHKLDDGGDLYIQFSREIAEGHFPPGDIFFDHTLPNLFPPLPPVLFGTLILIFHNVSTAYLCAAFIFSAALFLLFYLLGFVIFEKNKVWSLFLAFVATLTPIAIHLPLAFFSLANFSNIVLKNFYPGIQTLLPRLFLDRIDYPLLTHLVYLPAVIALLAFWRKPKRSTAIATGVLAGLLFYTYFHIWVYWAAVIGISFLVAMIFFRKDREFIKGSAISLGVMIVISIPYFINQHILSALPSYQDYVSRIHVEVGRIFDLADWPSYLIYLLIAGLIYLVFWRRELRREAAIFWGFLIAAVGVLNVQLVTGFVPHPDHWPRAITIPIFVILAMALYEIVKRCEIRWPKIRRAVMAVLVVLILLLVVKKVVNSGKFFNPSPELLKNYQFPDELVASWRWMDAYLGEAKVISPSFLTSTFLPAFTYTRPAMPWGGATPISNYEIEQRFLVANKLFGVSEKIVEQRLRDGRGIVCFQLCNDSLSENNIKDARGFIYGLYFSDQPIRNQIPEAKLQELLSRYHQLKISWKDSAADFVYIGPWERQFTAVDFSKDSQLNQVYKNSEVEIYRIK